MTRPVRLSCALAVTTAVAVSGLCLTVSAWARDRGAAGYGATRFGAAHFGATGAGGSSHRFSGTVSRPFGHDPGFGGHRSGWYQRGFGGTRDPGWGYRFGPGFGPGGYGH